CSYIFAGHLSARMPKTILVVDDDPLYLDLVSDIFAAQEIEVITASNGAVALSTLTTATPSLIISDFDMPEMNGSELHSRVLENPKTKDIPFVFMTGSITDHALEQHIREHTIPVFSKANLVSELLRISRELRVS
ncbi:MAG: response regulator, partial [Bacteroidota bacterium]